MLCACSVSYLTLGFNPGSPAVGDLRHLRPAGLEPISNIAAAMSSGIGNYFGKACNIIRLRPKIIGSARLSGHLLRIENDRGLTYRVTRAGNLDAHTHAHVAPASRILRADCQLLDAHAHMRSRRRDKTDTAARAGMATGWLMVALDVAVGLAGAHAHACTRIARARLAIGQHLAAIRNRARQHGVTPARAHSMPQGARGKCDRDDVKVPPRIVAPKCFGYTHAQSGYGWLGWDRTTDPRRIRSVL